MSAFYVSNVEQYLMQDDTWPRFCANVAALPLDETSTFIRSIRDRTPNSPFALISELGSHGGRSEELRHSSAASCIGDCAQRRQRDRESPRISCSRVSRSRERTSTGFVKTYAPTRSGDAPAPSRFAQ